MPAHCTKHVTQIEATTLVAGHARAVDSIRLRAGLMNLWRRWPDDPAW